MNLNDYLQHIKNYEIPPSPPYGCDDYQRGISLLEARRECTERGCWTVIAGTWIGELADWIGDRKVLEIMAGAGWLAKGLRDVGIELIATDNGSWDKRHSLMRHLTYIEQYEAQEAVTIFADAEILLCSWPPYGKKAFIDACREWGGKAPIVYIGEGQGGCNAPDEFFENFIQDRNAPQIHLPRWYGLHDRIMIGHWKKEY